MPAFISGYYAIEHNEVTLCENATEAGALEEARQYLAEQYQEPGSTDAQLIFIDPDGEEVSTHDIVINWDIDTTNTPTLTDREKI